MVFNSMFHHDGHWEDHPTFTGTDAVPIRHRWHGNHGNQLHQGAVAHSAQIPEMPMRPRRIRSQEGPWFLAPRSTPEAALVKLREPLQPDQAMQVVNTCILVQHFDKESLAEQQFRSSCDPTCHSESEQELWKCRSLLWDSMRYLLLIPAVGAGAQIPQIQEGDVFLGGSAFTSNESENLGIIYKWLDDIIHCVATV
eukprot:s871_g13.t1